MGTVTSMWSYEERKEEGDDHEKRVQRELGRRGWTVDPYGQGVISEIARRVLQQSESRLRWDPDFIVTRDPHQFWVDAKSSMWGKNARRYFVSKQSLASAVLVEAHTLMPVYYVFHNLSVATPHDVIRFCGLRHFTEAASYVSFPVDLPMPFDSMFGPPPDEMGALRLAA